MASMLPSAVLAFEAASRRQERMSWCLTESLRSPILPTCLSSINTLTAQLRTDDTDGNADQVVRLWG